MPSSEKSVVTSESCPAGIRSTAQSSPIPVGTSVGRALPSAGSGQALPASLWPDPTILRIPAISAFSGSGTAHSLYPRAKSATRNPVPVTFDYPPSVTPKWSPASLTGGTQFVTVNQSFTKPLAELSSASAWNCRRAGKFQALVAVLGRCRARESLHPQDGSVARKSQVVRTGVLQPQRLCLEFRT